MADGTPTAAPVKPAARREGPWSLRDISDEAKAEAKRQAKAKGLSLGAWVNMAILAQARAERDRQLPAPLTLVVRNDDIGPFWRWLRRRLGIEPAAVATGDSAAEASPGANTP